MAVTSRGKASLWTDGSYEFPNPWDDVASLHFPETIPIALRWCELLTAGDGLYTRALDRVMSYFITELNLDEVSDDEKEKWEDYLEHTLYMRNWLHSVGLDAMVYGNSFISVLPAFRRHLVCGGCRRIERPLSEIAKDHRFGYQWSNYQFIASCPACNYRGPWTRMDKKVGEKEACILKRWNPHDIEILWDDYTDQTAYIWKIPADYARKIREGKLYMLERAHWEIIDAVQHNCHLRFEPEMIYHWREDALAGIRNRGWGISRVLSNFRQTYYVQVLRRYNEAIALDYIMPMRFLTPEAGDVQSGRDPLTNFNLGTTVGHLSRVIRQHRRDPASIHILPFAVKYNIAGGEARQLAPVDLLKQGTDTQLANIGIPPDFWNANMNLQVAPVALRLFEASWTTLPRNLNATARFVLEHVAQILSWQQPDASFKPVAHADDIAATQARLQLMMGGQISQTTGLEAVRLKFRDEAKRILDDQRYQAELQARQQKEMESAAQMEQMVATQQQGGPGAPPGGAPGAAPGGGGAAGQPQPGAPAGPAGQAQQSLASQMAVSDNDPITPQDMWQRADTAARTLQGMSASQRLSELRKLRTTNPNLHPMVKSRLQQLDQEMSRQGRDLIKKQQFGGS